MIITPMSETVAGELAAQLRLQNWMSAAFPIGAYSYSHGIEAAIQAGWINDADSVSDWICDIAEHGSIRNDSIFISLAHAAVLADRACDLADINDLALALSSGAERRRETVELGRSFRRACSVWPLPKADNDNCIDTGTTDDDWALPVVVGALTAAHRLPLRSVIAMAAQSSMNNLAWIATRLVPLGQSSTLDMLCRFETLSARCAECSLQADLDDLGSCSVLIDIASLHHERQHSRVCLT